MGNISGLAGQMVAEDQCRCSLVTAVEEESDAFRQSGNETIHTGPFGDLPILIFSQDPDLPAPELSVKTAKQVSVIWNEMQEDLKRLSTHSRRIIAKGSGHFVFLDRRSCSIRKWRILLGKFEGEPRKGRIMGRRRSNRFQRRVSRNHHPRENFQINQTKSRSQRAKAAVSVEAVRFLACTKWGRARQRIRYRERKCGQGA